MSPRAWVAASMGRQAVAAIEAGKNSPTLESAFRIADVFGKPLEEVFQWTNEAGPAHR